MFSRTFSSWPPSIVKDLVTAHSCAIAGVASLLGVECIVLIQAEAAGRKGVEAPPDKSVHQQHEKRHHADAGDDEWGVSRLGDRGNERAEPVGLERGVAPGPELGYDAGAPGAARRGAST